MVDLPAIVRRGLVTVGLSPVANASPHDDAPAPIVDEVFSRSPEQVLASAGAFLSGLSVNDDSILQREGAQDLRLFDRLLDDDVAMSCLQQRRLAITSRDWEVTPGDDADPRSVKASEEFREMLSDVGFDRVSGLLHYSVWFGYGVAEALWTTKIKDGRTLFWLSDLIVPDRRWFGFDFAGDLRMTTSSHSFGGAPVPPNKFVTIRTGATHDFSFYGLGLAHWVYWPVWFKRASLRFWALFLEKMSNPTAVGEFKESDTPIERNKLLKALMSIGRDSAVIVPEKSLDTIKFMEAQRSGSGASSYREFLTEQNEAIMRIVLGQPGTSKATAGGIGSTQADVHADVKAEIVKADADLICEALNNTIAKWITRWNHGEDVAPPKVYRVLDDVEDLNTVAERDAKLFEIGWQRTEASVGDVYGEGYEKKPDPVVPPALAGAVPGPGGRLPNGMKPPANDAPPVDDQAASMFGAAEEQEIERLTAALMDEANPVLTEFAAGIRSSLATARERGDGNLSLEGARVAMLQAFEQYDPTKLAKLTGLAFVAERAASEAGVEDDLTA